MRASNACRDFVNKRSGNTELCANFRQGPSGLAQCEKFDNIGVTQTSGWVVLAPTRTTSIKVLEASIFRSRYPSKVNSGVIRSTSIDVIYGCPFEIPLHESERHKPVDVHTVRLPIAFKRNSGIPGRGRCIRFQDYAASKLPRLSFAFRWREVVKSTCASLVGHLQPFFIPRSWFPHFFIHGQPIMERQSKGKHEFSLYKVRV